LTSGEETTFEQQIPTSTFVGTGCYSPIVNALIPGLPIGAHMLSMRSEHIEGPWHGGGYMASPNNPNITVDLFPLLAQFANQNPAKNDHAFCYAAHPWSGQGWGDD